MGVTALRRASLAAGLFLLPAAASAHPGHADVASFVHGFAHPLTGADHVLAMVMVGLLAWQTGGRSVWLVPGIFLLAMTLGGILGVAGTGLPLVEAGIALSVAVPGLVLALGVRAPATAIVVLTGLFAVLHGYAHGTEMPADSGGVPFGTGFLLATTFLHLAGIGLGGLAAALAGRGGPFLTRTAGVLAGIAGGGMLAGIV